ncbi:nucleobase-ascorbate transporter 3 [Lolium perenne]|uniref:nucleobase-ascorbate transporter 3 n=1 Tax=Lolium perenne TaxID=4522 RepID=UPI0021EA16E2|nr:nucleobase-ascorbate transporter 3 [Lolium perenne]XP_051184273.1 nucleobase-ascorbate transporter 3 [Lolium perenne]XP_051184274.1 nucleobase-ascorbate transporter 3 [Lolium perenne]XP_051184275.1 nucleobase-ascorbate transporter 3 [Lolium perenne]XP_051184276.1 nucleobase-ascorbate transporter 3 [Lolium perenne]XP_051184277.1 nucleobase-ascorbate transporter 3 [Lolium perenne]XP_051184278.1 nucleobase-ascorbate transporter 3 [Lolium perenne]
MGEMNQPPPPPVGVPPPMGMGMGMQPMMNPPVGAGAMHPPHEQFHHLAYCVHSNPSWVQVAGLAFLHYLVMLGSTVMLASTIVPAMGGTPGDKARVIQSFLFMSGINTLLQTLVGTRLPTIMNASFAFVIPVLSIAKEVESQDLVDNHERFRHTMRTIQGALIVSSILNMILGFSRVWGAYAKKFSPVIMTPVVCVVGLGLFQIGFPQVGKCVEIGLPMLILAIVVQQYVPHYFRHMHDRTSFLFERYSLLLCISIVWAFAAILTAAGAYNRVSLKTQQHCRTDKSFLMSSAPWIKIPFPFQWGMPIFTAGHSFGMMGAVLVSAFESTGAHFATARLAGATPPPAHVLSRSIGLQGIGQFLEGMFGAPAGSSVSVENIGLLGLTKVGSRRVIQISTGFMIFFSIFGKFGAFFASIPLPIFAAIYCILFGIVAAVGVSFGQFQNNNSIRNIYIIGLSLFLGISIPQYFSEYTASAGRGPAHTNAGWFNDIINTVFGSGPTVALIVASGLDNTLEVRGHEADRGLSWFIPFLRRRKGYSDPRNEEFYSYPIRVHDFIPSRFL